MNSMTYVYEASQEHALTTLEFETPEEAIRSAAADLELGNAWPEKIASKDGCVMWEQSGPLTTDGTLKMLAAEHGVEWPAA